MSSNKINNKSRYYSSITNQFIYPEYNRYIKLFLENYFNIKFKSPEDCRLKIKIKFDYYELIYKRPLHKFEYYLKVKFFIDKLITFKEPDKYKIDQLDGCDYLNDHNKFSMRIYPKDLTLPQYELEHNIQKSQESLQYHPDFFLENSIMKSSLSLYNYDSSKKRFWDLKDGYKLLKEIATLNNFIESISNEMIPKLCEMWNESLDIILQNPSE